MIAVLLDIFWIPIGGFLSFLIFISAINKSIGVRKAYVNLLLRIFEVNILAFVPQMSKHRFEVLHCCGGFANGAVLPIVKLFQSP